MAELLLDYGCKIDVINDKGQSALYLAVWSHKLGMVEMLIAAGCDLNLQDSNGDSALMVCATKGYEDIMEVLLNNGSEINLSSNDGNTALHYGARHGRHTCLKLLICHKPDIEAKNMWNATSLLYAAESNHEECVTTLLQSGADITSQSRNKRTVLHYVASHGMVRCVKSLLCQHIHVDAPDADGNTPLMGAVIKNQPKTVQTLLQYGCQVHSIGRCSIGGAFTFCSPLEAAVHLGHLIIAKMLYAVGVPLEFLHCFDFCYIIRLNAPVSAWVQEMRSFPRSLLDICRIHIRSLLGTDLIHKTQLLPVPKMLQHFLAYHDLATFFKK